MSILTYKNILAVARDCKNQTVIQLLRDNYKFWFPEQRQPFSYASVNDKVIVFYPQTSTLSETITCITDDVKFTHSELPVGALKFLSDGSMIKIIECKFCTSEMFKACLVIFRDYLLETIRRINLPDYNSVNFVIFWDKELLNPIVSELIKQVGLLSNDQELAHCFTISEIQGGPPPKCTPELKFGPLPQSFDVQNPYAPVLSTSGQPSTFGINQQQSGQPTSSTFGSGQPSTFGINQQQSGQPSTFGINQQQSGQPTSSTFGSGQSSTFGLNNPFTRPFSFPTSNNSFSTKPNYNWSR